MVECKCGCGKEVNNGKFFIRGHHVRIKHPTKNKTYEESYGIKKAKKIKKQLSELRTGRKNSRYKKINLIKVKELSKLNYNFTKIAKIMNLNTDTLKNRIKQEIPKLFFAIKKQSYSGKNNSQWKNGISKESYGLEFNKYLKRKVYKKHGYQCKSCYRCIPNGFISNSIRLVIHHIDWNKKNNCIQNLIPLCQSCHLKVHHKKLEVKNEETKLYDFRV